MSSLIICAARSTSTEFLQLPDLLKPSSSLDACSSTDTDTPPITPVRPLTSLHRREPCTSFPPLTFVQGLDGYGLNASSPNGRPKARHIRGPLDLQDGYEAGCEGLGLAFLGEKLKTKKLARPPLNRAKTSVWARRSSRASAHPPAGQEALGIADAALAYAKGEGEPQPLVASEKVAEVSSREVEEIKETSKSPAGRYSSIGLGLPSALVSQRRMATITVATERKPGVLDEDVIALPNLRAVSAPTQELSSPTQKPASNQQNVSLTRRVLRSLTPLTPVLPSSPTFSPPTVHRLTKRPPLLPSSAAVDSPSPLDLGRPIFSPLLDVPLDSMPSPLLDDSPLVAETAQWTAKRRSSARRTPLYRESSRKTITIRSQPAAWDY